jgi:hypothetical protein
MCFLRISEHLRLLPYTTTPDWFCITKVEIVYCAVRTESLYITYGKSLRTYKSCCKWCSRASTQAWTRLILFANTFCRSAFGKSLCTYKRCWKWYPRPSTQAWTLLILFTNTFCRSAFGMSLCTYKTFWKWCPRASIQAFDADNQIYVP